MGDLKSRRNIIIGPFKIYLDSTETNPETGTVYYDDVENETTGELERVARKEKEPFLTELYFKKNILTPSLELQLSKVSKDEDNAELGLRSNIKYMLTFLHKWDLKNNAKPVPVDFDSIIEADVDSEIVHAIIMKYYEAIRPPKV